MTTATRLLTCLLVLSATTVLAETSTDTAAVFDVEAATQAYLDKISPEQRAASDAYFEGGYWLDFWQWLFGLLVAWILLHFRISTRMRDLGERLGRVRFFSITAYIIQYLVFIFVVTLPLTIHRDFSREHDYGLSNLTFSGWFNEQLTELGVELVLGTLGIALIYLVIRKAPKTWTIWGSLAAIAMFSSLLMAAPVYISPIFNDYQPLTEGPIKQKILSLARANAVPADDVYQFDASRQSTRISANVSGLLGTTRISLNDNLLNRTSTESIEAVMGHEMGHYALNHSPKRIIHYGIIIVIGFAFLQWVFERVVRPAWGIRGVTDIAGLPLLMALFSTYLFLMTPVTNSITRINEIEADIYGLNASRQPDGFSEAIVGLSEYRKMMPGYWEEIFLFDHPSGYSRIRMSMQWKKENIDAAANN